MASEVTEHLRALFVGVAPERTPELEEFWERFGPVVQIVPDDDQGEAPVMEAGMYRYLRFNHRILRMIWLLGFSAWEGYVLCAIELKLLTRTEVRSSSSRFHEAARSSSRSPSRTKSS